MAAQVMSINLVIQFATMYKKDEYKKKTLSDLQLLFQNNYLQEKWQQICI